MEAFIKINELTGSAAGIGPFAVYPGEHLLACKAEKFYPMSITDIDRVILVVVNKYLVISSHLLLQALTQAGVTGLEQKELQTRLHRLTEAMHLRSFLFENENGTRAAGKVYAVGCKGRSVLEELGVHPRLGGYIAQLDSTTVKRYLAVNQYLINTQKDFHKTEVGRAVLVPDTGRKERGLIFRAYGMVEEENKTVIVEAVRRAADKDYLVERLDRMDETLSHRRCNTPVQKHVELVLIAENESHLREINGWLKGRRYDKLRICLSTDRLVHSQPEHCLVEREKTVGFFHSLFAACL